MHGPLPPSPYRSLAPLPPALIRGRERAFLDLGRPWPARSFPPGRLIRPTLVPPSLRLLSSSPPMESRQMGPSDGLMFWFAVHAVSWEEAILGSLSMAASAKRHLS